MKCITIVETPGYILMSIQFEEGHTVTWNELYGIKNSRYRDLAFVEIHPPRTELVDNANVRHLYHLKGVELPSLTTLENEKEYQIIECK